MDAAWLDSHHTFTIVRASWAQHLTQPGTHYGIADALGEEATRKVFSQPATATLYLHAATVGACDAILRCGASHARNVLEGLPIPHRQGFELTTAHLHTAYEWIGHTLTGHVDDAARLIRDALDGHPGSETATRYAVALLLLGSIAATPEDQRSVSHA